MAKNTARVHCVGLCLVITEEGSVLAVVIRGGAGNSLRATTSVFVGVFHPMALYVGEVRLPWVRQGCFSELRKAWLETFMG